MPMPVRSAGMPRRRRRSTAARASSSRRARRSHGVVILKASGVARRRRRPCGPAAAKRAASSVWSSVARGVGGVELRRAGSPAASAPRRASSGRRSRGSRRRASTRLIVSADGQPGDDPAARALDRRARRASNWRRGRERAGRVVHEHDLDRRPQRGEPGGDGRLAGRSAGDDADVAGGAARGGRGELGGLARRARPARRRRPARRSACRATPSQRRSRIVRPGELDERLRDAGAEARAAARGDDDDRPTDAPSRLGAAVDVDRAVVRSARRRGPRRAASRPSLRRSSRRARARRSGSGAPWRACASRRPTGRGPGRGATGRGRPRRP